MRYVLHYRYNVSMGLKLSDPFLDDFANQVWAKSCFSPFAENLSRSRAFARDALPVLGPLNEERQSDSKRIALSS